MKFIKHFTKPAKSEQVYVHRQEKQIRLQPEQEQQYNTAITQMLRDLRNEEPLEMRVSELLYNSILNLRNLFNDKDKTPVVKHKDLDRLVLVYLLNRFIPPEVIMSDFNPVPISTSFGPAYPSDDNTLAWILTPDGVRLIASDSPLFDLPVEQEQFDADDFVADTLASDDEDDDMPCLKQAAIIAGYDDIDEMLQDFTQFVNIDENDISIDNLFLSLHYKLKRLDALSITCIIEYIKASNTAKPKRNLLGKRLFIGNKDVNIEKTPKLNILRRTRVNRRTVSQPTTGQIINGFNDYKKLTGNGLDTYASTLAAKYPDNSRQIEQAIKLLKLVQPESKQKENKILCVPSNDWRKILFYKLLFDPLYFLDIVRLLILPTVGVLELWINSIFEAFRRIQILWVRPFGWLPVITIYEEWLLLLAIREYEVMCTFLKFKRDMTLGLPIALPYFADQVAKGQKIPFSSKLTFEQRKVLSLLALGYNAYLSKYVSVEHVKSVLGNVLI